MRRDAHELPTTKLCLGRETCGLRVRRASPSRQEKQSPMQPSNEPGHQRNDSQAPTVCSNGSSSSSSSHIEPKGLELDLAAELPSLFLLESRSISCLLQKLEKVGYDHRETWKWRQCQGGRAGARQTRLELAACARSACNAATHLLEQGRLRSRQKGPLSPGEGQFAPVSWGSAGLGIPPRQPGAQWGTGLAQGGQSEDNPLPRQPAPTHRRRGQHLARLETWLDLQQAGAERA